MGPQLVPPRSNPSKYQRYDERQRCRKNGWKVPAWAQLQKPSKTDGPRPAFCSNPNRKQRRYERLRCLKNGWKVPAWAQLRPQGGQNRKYFTVESYRAGKLASAVKYQAKQRTANGEPAKVKLSRREGLLAPKLASESILLAKKEVPNLGDYM